MRRFTAEKGLRKSRAVRPDARARQHVQHAGDHLPLPRASRRRSRPPRRRVQAATTRPTTPRSLPAERLPQRIAAAGSGAQRGRLSTPSADDRRSADELGDAAPARCSRARRSSDFPARRIHDLARGSARAPRPRAATPKRQLVADSPQRGEPEASSIFKRALAAAIAAADGGLIGVWGGPAAIEANELFGERRRRSAFRGAVNSAKPGATPLRPFGPVATTRRPARARAASRRSSSPPARRTAVAGLPTRLRAARRCGAGAAAARPRTFRRLRRRGARGGAAAMHVRSRRWRSGCAAAERRRARRALAPRRRAAGASGVLAAGRKHRVRSSYCAPPRPSSPRSPPRPPPRQRDGASRHHAGECTAGAAAGGGRRALAGCTEADVRDRRRIPITQCRRGGGGRGARRGRERRGLAANSQRASRLMKALLPAPGIVRGRERGRFAARAWWALTRDAPGRRCWAMRGAAAAPAPIAKVIHQLVGLANGGDRTAGARDGVLPREDARRNWTGCARSPRVDRRRARRRWNAARRRPPRPSSSAGPLGDSSADGARARRAPEMVRLRQQTPRLAAAPALAARRRARVGGVALGRRRGDCSRSGFARALLLGRPPCAAGAARAGSAAAGRGRRAICGVA